MTVLIAYRTDRSFVYVRDARPEAAKTATFASRVTLPAAPGADLLFGAKAIADFLLNEGVTGMTRTRVYQWIKAGKLPATKLGGHVTASKSAIRERLKTGMTIP
jgi:excisionase family DNA binding protein